MEDAGDAQGEGHLPSADAEAEWTGNEDDLTLIYGGGTTPNTPSAVKKVLPESATRHRNEWFSGARLAKLPGDVIRGSSRQASGRT